MNNSSKAISWIAQIIAAVIMGQTLFYKFTGHPQTLEIFQEELNMPNGHYIIGALELLACILLILPQSVVYGAILGAGLMTGAIIAHITKLGWEGERGALGLYAVLTLTSCLVVLIVRRRQIPIVKGIISEGELTKQK